MRDFAAAYEAAAERRYDVHGVQSKSNRLTANGFARKTGEPLTKRALREARKSNPSFNSHLHSLEVKHYQDWSGETSSDDDLPYDEIGSGGERCEENRAEFLRVLENKMDHSAAQIASSIRWEEIQKLLRDDEEFRAGYERLMGAVPDPMKLTKVAVRAMDVQMTAAFVDGNHTAARGLTSLVDERKSAGRGRPPKSKFTPDKSALDRAGSIYASMMIKEAAN